MRLTAILAVAAILCCGPPAGADDVFPPLWRGEARTIFARWDSWGVDWDVLEIATYQPDILEIVPDNQGVGIPEYDLNIDDGAVIWDWFLSPATDGEIRYDVVEMRDDYDLSFTIPNFPDGADKIMNIQITYAVDDNSEPLAGLTWSITGGSVVDFLFLDSSITGGWVTDVAEIIIEPNPIEEEISLFFYDAAGVSMYPAYIDQVVIDTICPEPTTIIVLALGGLAVLKRRDRP